MIKRLITRLEFVKDVSIAVLLDKVSNVSRDENFVRKWDKANIMLFSMQLKSIHK